MAEQTARTGKHHNASEDIPDPEPDRVERGTRPANRLRWMAPAALLLAVIAVGLAVAALMRPTTEPPVTAAAGGMSADDAQAQVCAAFDTVRKAVSVQTNTDLGPDPVARAAVAGNARLATVGGGSYLLSRLDPATPTELADAVRSFARVLQDVGMSQLVGTPNTDPALTTLMGEAQAASPKIAGICGLAAG